MLFACHGPSHQLSYEYERELQAVTAARLVEELAEAVGARHVVVGGDFNADPGGSSVAFWRGERSLEGTSVCYLDAWERARPGEAGHTFTPRNPLVSENKPAPGRDRRHDVLMSYVLNRYPSAVPMVRGARQPFRIRAMLTQVTL